MESSSIREWAQRVRMPLVILAVVSLVLAMVTVVNPTKANAEVALGKSATIVGYGENSTTGDAEGNIYYNNGEIITVGNISSRPILVEGAALFDIDKKSSDTTTTGDPGSGGLISGLIGLITGDDSESPVYAYCLEPFTVAREKVSNSLRVASWDQYSPKAKARFEYVVGNINASESGFGFDTSNGEKINWILHNSYPYLTLDEVEAQYNLNNLRERAAVAATQAAIWYYTTGGVSPNFGDRSQQGVYKNLSINYPDYEQLYYSLVESAEANPGIAEPREGGEKTGLLGLDDVGQSVIFVEPKPEPKNPKLELKKFVSADPEAKASDDGKWFDAQDEEAPVSVEPGSTMSIKYVVTNRGDVDLKNVKITDVVTDGGSKDEIQSAINDELNVEMHPEVTFDLPAGEAKTVVIDVPAPAAGGDKHRDEASATATPVIPGNDQPEDVTSNKDEVNVKTSEEKPKSSISTSATLQSETGQVVKGATVIDTVSYTGLVPGKQYTLTAELVDKADESGKTVVGSGSKTFTPESADGQVDVEIAVTAEEPVASAVAFETLTSEDKDAQGQKSDTLPEGSAENVIAEHKEIDDAAQTVTGDLEPALQLKKLLNGVDADDSQDSREPANPRGDKLQAHEASSVELSAGASSFELTFQVQNTGDVDLENITVSDTVTESVDGELADEVQAAIDTALTGKTIESLAVGEMKEITVTVALLEGVTLPAGWKHHDVAKAEGQYTPEGSESQKVVSNEDEANAKTPKKQFAPSISTSVDPKAAALKSGMQVVDTVSYEGLAPNSDYTLSATLVDKADKSKVLGSGTAELTTGAATEADGSVKGTQDVPITITVSDEQLKDVKAAVAFEELTSQVVDKQGNPLKEQVETPIAEHKDINDAAQTVRNAKPKLELKKYIDGSDAQDEGKPGAETVEVEPSSTMTIKYVVTNTGTVDLTDVRITDEVTGGASKEKIAADIAAELSKVAPFDLKVGASNTVEITVSTPANGGETHRDIAKAEGVYTPEGSTESQKVPSNEDEANAKTPKKQFAPTVDTTADLTDATSDVVEDTVTLEGLVEGASYTLTGQLFVKNEDGSQGVLLGTSAPKQFVADSKDMDDFSKAEDGSVSGVVVMDVPGASKLTKGQQAVVFETLTSQDEAAQANKAPNLPEAVASDVVAVHHDINDEAQTVTGLRESTPTTSNTPKDIVLPDMNKPTVSESPAAEPSRTIEDEAGTPTTSKSTEPAASSSTTPKGSEVVLPDQRPAPGSEFVPTTAPAASSAADAPRVSADATKSNGVVTSEVKYDNLKPDTDYVITGEVLDATTGKPTGEANAVTFRTPQSTTPTVSGTARVQVPVGESVVSQPVRTTISTPKVDSQGRVVGVDRPVTSTVSTPKTVASPASATRAAATRAASTGVSTSSKPVSQAVGAARTPTAQRVVISNVPSGSTVLAEHMPAEIR